MEETIKRYLEQRALVDPSVARNLKKENKSIKGCCDYIYKMAKKAAKKEMAIMIDNDVVYGWAVHYYDEDNIKEDKKSVPVAKVVVPKQEDGKPKYIQCDLFGGMEDEA